jgi:hypothetical protein
MGKSLVLGRIYGLTRIVVLGVDLYIGAGITMELRCSLCGYVYAPCSTDPYIL